MHAIKSSNASWLKPYTLVSVVCLNRRTTQSVQTPRAVFFTERMSRLIDKLASLCGRKQSYKYTRSPGTRTDKWVCVLSGVDRANNVILYRNAGLPTDVVLEAWPWPLEAKFLWPRPWELHWQYSGIILKPNARELILCMWLLINK